MGFFYERDKGEERFCFRVFIGAISSMNNILWDIYIEWGLWRKNDKYYLLREKIAFPTIVYCFAMIYDIFIMVS